MLTLMRRKGFQVLHGAHARTFLSQEAESIKLVQIQLATITGDFGNCDHAAA
jgi:hypothetical protein